jgi:fructose-1-phosphate kinase PfkB-like protein
MKDFSTLFLLFVEIPAAAAGTGDSMVAALAYGPDQELSVEEGRRRLWRLRQWQ